MIIPFLSVLSLLIVAVWALRLRGASLMIQSRIVISFFLFLFFVKHKTAYDMRISDWSSDVCSSDLSLFDVMKEEIEEGRELFRSRVTPDIFEQNIYDRALVDVLVKSKGHVKSKIW